MQFIGKEISKQSGSKRLLCLNYKTSQFITLSKCHTGINDSKVPARFCSKNNLYFFSHWWSCEETGFSLSVHILNVSYVQNKADFLTCFEINVMVNKCVLKPYTPFPLRAPWRTVIGFSCHQRKIFDQVTKLEENGHCWLHYIFLSYCVTTCGLSLYTKF